MDSNKRVDNRYRSTNMYNNTSSMYKWNININIECK